MLATNINLLYSYQAEQTCALCIEGPYIYSTKETKKIRFILAWTSFSDMQKQLNNTNARQKTLVTFRVL